MPADIIKLFDLDTLKLFLPVIRKSFQTVADQFGLTETNSPTNPAFTDIEKLNILASKAECYGLFADGRPAGFFAIEYNNDSKTAFLERVCVLPEYRHNKYGKTLLEQAEKECLYNDINKISIGIININEVLKTWYKAFGFIEVEVKTYPHLPFEVCFLDKKLK